MNYIIAVLAPCECHMKWNKGFALPPAIFNIISYALSTPFSLSVHEVIASTDSASLPKTNYMVWKECYGFSDLEKLVLKINILKRFR